MTKEQLGAYLRAARESRGLQLEDVAKTTRIGKNYLMAMEDGEFEKLPNIAYVKGFLRLYAGVIGLSGDEVVALYEGSIGTAAVSAEEICDKAEAGNKRGGGQNHWLLPLLILALILVAAFLMQEKEEKKGVVPATVETPAVPAIVPPVQPAPSSAKQGAISSPTVNDVPPAALEIPADPGSGSKGIVLKLKCNQDSALIITIDGSLTQHYQLKAGDIIEWKAESSFSLDIGNAGGVEAEFNGKVLKPFGASGISTHVVLNKDQAP